MGEVSQSLKEMIWKSRTVENAFFGKYKHVTYDEELDMELPGAMGVWLVERPYATIPVTDTLPVKEDNFEILDTKTMEEGDHLLVSAPKTGTHWMWEVMSMLVKCTSAYEQSHKIQNMIEITPYETIMDYPTPRILAAHMQLSHVPPKLRRPDTKVVVMLRNPKDVMVSWYHHFKGMHPPKPESFTWEAVFKYLLYSKIAVFGNYLDHVADTWDNYKDNPNVLIVFYEDLKRKSVEQVERVAKHLGVKYTTELISGIADAANFDKMKRGKDGTEQGLREVYGKNFTLIRKGEIGDWKNMFTVAQNEEFHRVYDEWNKTRNVPFRFE